MNPKDFIPGKPEGSDRRLAATSYGNAGSHTARLDEYETSSPFELPPNFTFPSDRRLAKYPSIAIDGNVNDYVEWIHNHTEIDRRVPPIFTDFIINYSYTDATSIEYYEIFVHYVDDFTKFYYRLRMNGVKLVYGMVDYDAVSGTDFGVSGSITDKAFDLYEENWLKNTLISAAFIVLAVQAYMLYFKPEIVEKIYAPSEQPKVTKPSQTRKRITVEPIKLRKTKIKRITLSEVDRPPKNIDYKKLSWYVRGHYRHVGKGKKLKYIQPYTCNRGGKKYRRTARKYLIPELNVQNEKEQNYGKH